MRPPFTLEAGAIRTSSPPRRRRAVPEQQTFRLSNRSCLRHRARSFARKAARRSSFLCGPTTRSASSAFLEPVGSAAIQTHIGTPEQSKRLANSREDWIFWLDLVEAACRVRSRHPLRRKCWRLQRWRRQIRHLHVRLKQWEALGTRFPYHDASPPTPSWIALSAATMSSDDLIRGTLAHEMMHAIDDLFAKAEEEETVLAGRGARRMGREFCAHKRQHRWEYANELFSHPTFTTAPLSRIYWSRFPLRPPPRNKSEDDRESSRADSAYRKYVFFFYLQHRVGPSVLRTILEKEASLSSMSAIDQALSRGFAFALADFVVTA